jgi:hypothetical protein
MANMYNKGLYYLLNNGGGSWDDGGLTVKCALVTSVYAFSADHNFFNEITNEITNTNYPAGGNAIAGRSVTEDDTGDQIKCDATDVTFTSLAAGNQPYAAVIYRDTGTPTTSELLAYCILTTPPAPDGNNYVIQWGADGCFKVTNA